MKMTDLVKIVFVVWLLVFIWAFAIHSQAVKPALAPQPQAKAQIGQLVNPVIACRVIWEEPLYKPIIRHKSRRESCAAAEKQANAFLERGIHAWVEPIIAKEKP